jgi:hypothetical protein
MLTTVAGSHRPSPSSGHDDPPPKLPFLSKPNQPITEWLRQIPFPSWMRALLQRTSRPLSSDPKARNPGGTFGPGLAALVLPVRLPRHADHPPDVASRCHCRYGCAAGTPASRLPPGTHVVPAYASRVRCPCGPRARPPCPVPALRSLVARSRDRSHGPRRSSRPKRQPARPCRSPKPEPPLGSEVAPSAASRLTGIATFGRQRQPTRADGRWYYHFTTLRQVA